jgi:transposase
LLGWPIKPDAALPLRQRGCRWIARPSRSKEPYSRTEDEANEALIRITYGYSRDHRADLKQWQLSRASTTNGVPLGLQVLDGNASDQVTLAQQVAEVVYQFRAEREEAPIDVADGALYREATLTSLSKQEVWWVSRVPETSLQAKALVAEKPVHWQGTQELRWVEREVRIGDRTERWIVTQSAEGVAQQHATLQRRVEQERQRWTKRLRELEQRPFACEADALADCTQARKEAPSWLELAFDLEVSVRHASRGRPRAETIPKQQVWTLHGTVRVKEATVQAEVARKAKCIVATNVPATRKGAEDALRLDKAQSGVERGCAFRNRSAVPGLVRVCQEDRARDGDRVHHGPLSARLPAGRAAHPSAHGPDGSNRARPTQEAHESARRYAGCYSVLRASAWS